ncbi:TPA: hypothetical protein NJ142_004668 [Vibrio parahaemolyticus]|nr:hypothetical protein [Vibrio parahaemolyticus]
MNISEILSFVSAGCGVITVGLAIYAINSWKVEFRSKEVYQAYSKAEVALFSYHKSVKKLSEYYYRNTQIQLGKGACNEPESEEVLDRLINDRHADLTFQLDWLMHLCESQITDELSSLISSYFHEVTKVIEFSSFNGFLEHNQNFEQYSEALKGQLDGLDSLRKEATEMIRVSRLAQT